MRNKIIIYSSFLMLLLLTSCITNRNTRLLQDKNYVAEYDSVSYIEYKLKINDELKLRVISLNEEITKAFNLGRNQATGTQNTGSSYRIYQDGTIDIPFSEPIFVEGLTLREAERKISDQLKYMSEDITVKLELENNYYYLVGRSGKGRYNIYKDRLTIYQAIAAGGFSPGVGNLKKVKVIRQQENNEPTVITFDLRSKSIIDSEYYYIQPNDVVYVETTKGNFFRIGAFTALISVISSSLTFLLLMLDYAK